jgi:hypothetical protein
MVEESDEQYEKKNTRAKISVAELKKRRYENYLKLNLKMTKKGLNQIPERKADESNILSYTVSGTLYGTVSSIPAMQAIEVWSPTVQIRQLLREEKINSQDAKMTLFLQQGWINLQGNIKWVDVPIVFNP